MVQFKDKTLLITGGGTGIGEAIAYQFAQRGTNVILTGLGEEQLTRGAADEGGGALPAVRREGLAP